MKKKIILLIDSNESFRESVASKLREQNVEVIEGISGPEAIKLAKAHKIDMAFIDLFTKFINIIDLVKTLQKIHRKAEMVVLTEVLNANISETMREIGVFRVLKKPFDSAELEDALHSGLASNRIFRIAVQERIVHPEAASKLRALIAHPDNTVFAKVLKLCLEEHFEIDTVKSKEELIEKTSYSFYDIMITSSSLINSVIKGHEQKNLNLFRKPILCLIDGDDEQVISKNELKPFFDFSLFFKTPLEKKDFHNGIEKVLPKYLKEINKTKKTGVKSRFSKRFYLIRSIYNAPSLIFIIIVLIAAAAVGYFASSGIVEKKKEETNRSLDGMKQMEDIQKFMEFQKWQERQGGRR